MKGGYLHEVTGARCVARKRVYYIGLEGKAIALFKNLRFKPVIETRFTLNVICPVVSRIGLLPNILGEIVRIGAVYQQQLSTHNVKGFFFVFMVMK